MQIRCPGAWGLLLAAAVLGGCASTRSEVKIAAPGVAAYTVTKPRAVVIRSVRDLRLFQDYPGSPSTPSLGVAGTAEAVEAAKARAIARKRSGFGQGTGDVLLQEGQTVTGVVREHLASAFRQAGYRVAPDVATAGAAPVLVDVQVRKFWAWRNAGLSNITLAAQIETDVAISNDTGRSTISVRTQDVRQAVGDGDWVDIVQKALAAYREDAARRFAAPAPL